MNMLIRSKNKYLINKTFVKPIANTITLTCYLSYITKLIKGDNSNT